MSDPILEDLEEKYRPIVLEGESIEHVREWLKSQPTQEIELFLNSFKKTLLKDNPSRETLLRQELTRRQALGPNRVSQLLHWFKSQWIFAIIIVIAMAVGGVANLWENICQLLPFCPKADKLEQELTKAQLAELDRAAAKRDKKFRDDTLAFIENNRNEIEEIKKDPKLMLSSMVIALDKIKENGWTLEHWIEVVGYGAMTIEEYYAWAWEKLAINSNYYNVYFANIISCWDDETCEKNTVSNELCNVAENIYTETRDAYIRLGSDPDLGNIYEMYKRCTDFQNESFSDRK